MTPLTFPTRCIGVIINIDIVRCWLTTSDDRSPPPPTYPSANTSIMPSNSNEDNRIKSLADDLELRGRLRAEYQASFFGVASLLGPLVFTFIVDRHMRRDIRLTSEAEQVVIVSTAGMGLGANRAEIVLKTHLELQTILCTEYRDAYFTLINLIGAGTFLVVGDYHRQRDGVVEAEAARIDNAIQKIRDAAN